MGNSSRSISRCFAKFSIRTCFLLASKLFSYRSVYLICLMIIIILFRSRKFLLFWKWILWIFLIFTQVIIFRSVITWPNYVRCTCWFHQMIFFGYSFITNCKFWSILIFNFWRINWFINRSRCLLLCVVICWKSLCLTKPCTFMLFSSLEICLMSIEILIYLRIITIFLVIVFRISLTFAKSTMWFTLLNLFHRWIIGRTWTLFTHKLCFTHFFITKYFFHLISTRSSKFGSWHSLFFRFQHFTKTTKSLCIFA